MRRHAFALLTLLALVTPAMPAVGGGASIDVTLEPGRQLVRRGDYRQAQQFYADTASQSAEMAPRARLLEARAALADGDTSTAESVLQELLAVYPTSDQTAGAYFTLEQVRRSAGDCAGALRALDAFEASSPENVIGPYAALQRAQCSALLEDWPTELSAARSALAIEGGGPRLTQIEALERAAEADLKLGRKQEALELYNRSLALAGTRAYTAEMLFTTATIARALGQTKLAADRYRAVVLDYADQARAPGALDALTDMGFGATVSPYQAGLVRLKSLDYAAAVAQFDQVDGASADWGSAQLGRAEALLKLGAANDARSGLDSVAQTQTPSAASALLRLGQLDERDGDEAAAETHYQDMAQVAPERAAEALLHVGFTRFVRGDREGALAAWQSGLADNPQTDALQAQLWYWTARGEPPSADVPRQEALNRAAAAAPESYFGLRAQDQLTGTLSMAALPTSDTTWLRSGSAELQEKAAWFATLGTTPDRVAQDVRDLASMRRADQLLELGLRTEATWEIDAEAQRYAQARDIAHMSAVAEWAAARDLPQLTLRIGKQMRDLVGLNGLPRALKKLVYPAGWGDLVAEDARNYGVDPLLVLALMRQESSFDPRAQSGAQAIGLTQIVPATARGIAAKLGRDDFAVSDLLKPRVSVEFGTWFISQLLSDYRGRLFPALAAYNAGQGNVSRWLQRFGDDPDLLIEQIPFTETQTYLRTVYDNYWHYRALYGASP